MPTELKGANALRKALRKFDPDLDKETRDEMVGFLKPLVKKARGFMPSNDEMPSNFVGTSEAGKFPKYDSTIARRGVVINSHLLSLIVKAGSLQYPFITRPLAVLSTRRLAVSQAS